MKVLIEKETELVQISGGRCSCRCCGSGDILETDIGFKDSVLECRNACSGRDRVFNRCTDCHNEGELSSKLCKNFNNIITGEIRDEVKSILDTYGTEEYEQEPFRVRLAILKLSHTDLEEIKRTTNLAKQDFRDILTWAEYPRQSKKWSMPDGPKKQKLIEADRAEYEAWLST